MGGSRPTPTLFAASSAIVSNYVWVKRGEVNVEHLKKLLTVTPRATSEFSTPCPVRCYAEYDDLFGIPRHYFFANRSREWLLDDRTLPGGEGDFSFVPGFEFRDGQIDAVNQAVWHLRQSHFYGAIVSCPPAFGKTVVAFGIICSMRVKPVLIVVHTEALLHQWQERIRQFLGESVRVGVAQGPKCDYQDKDIVMGMVESLAVRDYTPEFYNAFGLIITDEVHRLGAPLWSQAISKFLARWRVGLSATPKRNDKSENVFLWHIGDVLKFGSNSHGLVPKIRTVYTSWRWKGRTGIPSSILLKFLTLDTNRNRLIVEEIYAATKAGRKVIVISDRIQHLQTLRGLFEQRCGQEKFSVVCDYFIGGRTKAEYDVAAKADVLFATYQYAAEGVDIPALDTIMLTTPRVSIVKQACGRILREHPEKKDPIVVDFVDGQETIYRILAAKRQKIYREMEQE